MAYDLGDWTGAISDSGLTHQELWVAYAGIGGDLDSTELQAMVNGERDTSVREHNELAQALNEHFHDTGRNWPVPYRDPSLASE